jgi:hypothetical protein
VVRSKFVEHNSPQTFSSLAFIHLAGSRLNV